MRCVLCRDMVEWVTKMPRFKSYEEMLTFDSFIDRVEYLKLNGRVGVETFGSSRWLNQYFYKSDEWLSVRDFIIIRDFGCDLAIEGRELFKGNMYIHHIEPVTESMIEEHDPCLLDPNNLVLVSYDTHSAIHYGDRDLTLLEIADRQPNDTCLWKGIKNV